MDGEFHILGDMSSAINVLFDLDFQKLIGKIWKQKPGILVVVIFSQTEEGLNFFADSINPIKRKIWKTYEIGTLWKKYLKGPRSNLILYLKI